MAKILGRQFLGTHRLIMADHQLLVTPFYQVQVHALAPQVTPAV